MSKVNLSFRLAAIVWAELYSKLTQTIYIQDIPCRGVRPISGPGSLLNSLGSPVSYLQVKCHSLYNICSQMSWQLQMADILSFRPKDITFSASVSICVRIYYVFVCDVVSFP